MIALFGLSLLANTKDVQVRKDAVQIAKPENIFAFATVWPHVMHQDNASLGQSSRLVRAEYIHGTQVLDCVELLDDHFPSCHGNGALREVNRYDHRQHLGRYTNGHCRGKEECFEPVSPQKTIQRIVKVFVGCCSFFGGEPGH